MKIQLLSISALVLTTVASFGMPCIAIARESALSSVSHADQTIASLLNNIGRAKDRKDAGKGDDQMDPANSRLFHYLEEACKDKQLLTAPLKKAEEAGMTIVTSTDHKLRVYTWDSQVGGSMQFFCAIAQYLPDGATSSKVMVLNHPHQEGHENGETGDTGFWYRSLYTVHTKTGRPIYLLQGNGIYGSGCWNISLQAFYIKDGQLTPSRIFLTKEGKTDNLDNSGQGEVAEVLTVSKDAKTVTVPTYKSDGSIESKTVYVFDGTCYRAR